MRHDLIGGPDLFESIREDGEAAVGKLPDWEDAFLVRLVDVLTLAVCAVIDGAETWDPIAEYARSKDAFFRRFMELPKGVPSPDMFSRVLTKLDPVAFADRLGWAASPSKAFRAKHVPAGRPLLRASGVGEAVRMREAPGGSSPVLCLSPTA